MKSAIFRKKSIVTVAEEKQGLQRSLGAFNLTMIGVGAIIGAGLFVLTGKAAAFYAGPGVCLSFVLAAIICIFSALCYAELASMFPAAGSAYTYAYIALGELAAWVLGWCLTIEYLLCASTVAGGWSAYLASLLKDFGIAIPNLLTQAPFAYDAQLGWLQTGHFLNLPAMIIMGLVGILISRGIKTAAFLNNVLVFLKVGVILLFVICGVFHVNAENWHPFIPENSGSFGNFGWSGVFRGAGIVFFAFIGFDAISTLGQEARNPQKDMPRGMLGSLGISTLIYAVVALILTGVVSYTQLGVNDPIAVAFNALGPSFIWLRPIVKFAILAGLTSVILVMLMGQARIFYSMSRDGLLPKIFGSVHPRFRTPFFTTLVLTAVGMLMAGLFPVEVLGQLVSMGTLMGFAIVCFGVLVLRYKQPQLHRPFKTPLFPWIPLLGTLSCVAQMALLPITIWIQLMLWIAVGTVVYFFYGRKHSLAAST